MCWNCHFYTTGTVASNRFKSHRNAWCPYFFSKNALSDVWSEIHLARHNIVSTGQCVRGYEKNYIHVWYVILHFGDNAHSFKFYPINVPRKCLDLFKCSTHTDIQIFKYLFAQDKYINRFKVFRMKLRSNILI